MEFLVKNNEQLSANAAQLLDCMIQHYIKDGNLLDGAVGEYFLKYRFGTWDMVKPLIRELIHAQLIEERCSLSVSYALSASLWKELIRHHDLLAKWNNKSKNSIRFYSFA